MTTDTLPPRLRIEGPELIKPNGKRIVLKGVNFGSFGEDDDTDPAAVKALGANVVRIPLRWHGPYGNLADGTPIDSRDNDAYAFLRRANVERWLTRIQQCADAGLWVVPAIESRCGQSGVQIPEVMDYCDPYGLFPVEGRNFFTDKPLAKLYAIVWQEAAEHLRRIPNIAMLELLPEPLSGRDEDPWREVLLSFYARLMDAIREVDPDTPFLIGARDGYDILLSHEAWMSDRADVVYTGNLLNPWVVDPARFAKGLRHLTGFRDAAQAPVFVQQVGRLSAEDLDLVCMRNALEQMNAQRVGFAWWQWKQNTDTPDRYALHYKNGAGGWVPKQAELDTLAAYL